MEHLNLCAFQEMPFGRAPDLAVDGTLIAGSANILRYLGVKFGKEKRCNFAPKPSTSLAKHSLSLFCVVTCRRMR